VNKDIDNNIQLQETRLFDISAEQWSRRTHLYTISFYYLCLFYWQTKSTEYM